MKTEGIAVMCACAPLLAMKLDVAVIPPFRPKFHGEPAAR
jgi:hypothetical protein